MLVLVLELVLVPEAATQAAGLGWAAMADVFMAVVGALVCCRPPVVFQVAVQPQASPVAP